MTKSAEKLQKEWTQSPRWKGIERPYSAADVVRLSGSIEIEYTLARESTVQLRILDISGRVIRATLAHSEGAGPHEFRWDGTDETGSKMPPGVYLYELRLNGASQTRKAVLLR